MHFKREGLIFNITKEPGLSTEGPKIVLLLLLKLYTLLLIFVVMLNFNIS